MRPIILLLLVTAAGAAIVAGCSEDNKVPYFTRLHADNYCGVAPLLVEMTAVATGGDPFEQPTGGNSYLEMSWDFGDGSSTEGSSIVYHTYDLPGIYKVTVIAKDKDGDTSDPTGEMFIEVRDDSLTINAFAQIAGEEITTATTCEDILFNVLASACGFDTETGDYFRFLYTWEMDDEAETVYFGRNPIHAYAQTDTGQHNIKLTLVDPSRSITREDIVTLNVVQAEADLEVRKTVDNENPSRDDVITYQVVLLNNGPADCGTIQVTDRIPAFLTLVSADPSKGTYDPDSGIWDIGNLRSGNNVRLFLSAAVDTNGISRTNTAQVSRTNRCDPNSGNDSDQARITINP